MFTCVHKTLTFFFFFKRKPYNLCGNDLKNKRFQLIQSLSERWIDKNGSLVRLSSQPSAHCVNKAMRVSFWQGIFFFNLERYNVNNVPNKMVEEYGNQFKRYLADAWTCTSAALSVNGPAHLFLKIISWESCFLAGQSIREEIHY